MSRRRWRRSGRAGADFRRRDQDRRAERHVEPLRRPRRPGLGRRRAHGGRGLRRREEGHEGRDHLRRPPEQARRRLEHRAPVVRRRQGRRDRRRAQLVASRSPSTRSRGQEQGVPRLRRRHLRSHRQGLLAQHHPLDLRHLDARQRHRQRDRQDRRQHLVLPHRRLRLRPRARARHRGGGAEGGRQGAGQGAPSAQHAGLLLVPAAGAGSKAKIIGLANAGGDTINSIKQAAEFGIVKGGQNLAGLLVFLTDVHGLGLHDRAGPDLHRDVLLGPERPDARLRQALRRAEQRQASDHDPRRRLFGACCTTSRRSRR